MTSPTLTHDRFELRIFFKANPLAAWASARPCFEALAHADPILAPTLYFPKHGERESFSLTTAEKLFQRRAPPDVFFLENEHGTAVELNGFPSSRDPAGKFILRCPFASIAGDRGCELVTRLAADLGAACPLVYGWGHSEEDARLGKDPHVTNAWAPKEVYQAYGLTILGAAMVRKLSRTRVAASPAHRIEFLDDGAALIVTCPDLAALLAPAARQAQARTLAHLRPDQDEQKILRHLEERSAKLQPVDRTWDPDLADVFRIVVEAAPLQERAATETRFNRLRLPPPAPWRPVTEILPADVPNVAEVIDTYHRQGQTFVAGYHDQIAELMNADPDSLPFIDAHFYLRDYPAREDPSTLEQKFVPTLGAHFGTILERYLDGQWVPRQNVEESQVLVGKRAWLPFLLVKHFLASREAALEFSLTRVFREAARDAPATE